METVAQGLGWTRSRPVAWGVLALAAALLAACNGGGGGGGGGDGAPAAAQCSGSVNPLTVNDPLYPYQWHIHHAASQPAVLVPFNDATAPPNLNSDINQQTSHQTGCGIKVAVVDTGLEIAHEDLAPNVVAGGSIDFNTGGTDPTPTSSGGDHGTSVAGLIAARMNNGLGGRGVAGEASLVGYNFLSSIQTLAIRLASLGGATYSANVDVFNQSYGTTLASMNSSIEAQLLSGVTSLRGAKGAIYVKSAGNGFSSTTQCYANCSTTPVYLDCTLALAAGVSCQDVNMDGENSTPYQIIVAAMNAGLNATAPTKSSYSTAGSAVWISAPGGEFGGDTVVIVGSGVTIQPAMITTDLTNCSRGYSVGGAFNGTTDINTFNWAQPGYTNQLTYNANCNYVSTFNGTSSAAPVLSGAIAVLLQANPALTWRDVKYILAKTAFQVDSAKTAINVTCIDLTVGGLHTFAAVPAWVSTGSAFKFHNWYGFGRVNLDAAVAMATAVGPTWTPNGFGGVTAFNTLTTTPFATSVTSFPIPDCLQAGTGTASGTLTPTSPPTFIEAVQVNVCLTHANLGAVQLALKNMATSEISVALPARNGFNTIGVTNACQLFETNAFYGESSASGFQLIAYDTVATASPPTQQIDSWQVRVFGH